MDSTKAKWAAAEKAKRAKFAEEKYVTLESIALAHRLGTTETQNSGADFRECAAWNIKEALEAAYAAGVKAERAGRASSKGGK